MGMAPPGFHGPRDHERPLISLMLMWQDQLGLSADQERTLRELRTNFEKESIKRTADIDVAELELNGLLEADKVDMAKVEALAKKSAMLQAELRIGRVKTIEAGKAVLTSEQAAKFERLGHESMMEGMGMRMMGPGMSMPPMHPGAR
jgi:Spy/CpxP family protein refolding chaperone